MAAIPPADKYLLLDSRVLEQRKNARLVLGSVRKSPRNPLFAEDKSWEPRFDNLYANVLFDKEDGVYKCWYSPFIVDERVTHTPPDKRKEVDYLKAKPTGREMGVCYAVSKDGLEWEKPELGIVEFDGSRKNNLVFRGPHGSGVFKDLREPAPARRYKMFFKGGVMSVAFSSDGLHWSKPTPCPEIGAAGDTHNNAFWAPELETYVGITRLWDDKWRTRIVGRTQSTDFLKWTKAEPVLWAMPSEAHRQTYAMPVFRYAGVYLGLVMMFNTDSDTVDCELTWSADTRRWERVCPGQALIPRGRRDANDWGCIYAAAYPVVSGKEIRIYYGGNNGPHTNWRDGFFCLATLRPDGFAGIEPESADAAATVETAPVVCTGESLCVSADAGGGRLRYSVINSAGHGLDECDAVTADVTDARVTWSGNRNLADLKDKRIRLRFEMRDARLYAFGFA